LVDALGGPPPNLAPHDDERLVEQELPGGRWATGWLSPDVMIGGERSGRFRAEGQYHPATVHWPRPDGTVGWLRLRHRGPLAATASPGVLTVHVHDDDKHGRQPVAVETSHGGRFDRSVWDLDGRVIGYDGPPADENGLVDAGDDDMLTLRFA
jgi:hypothetical protein